MKRMIPPLAVLALLFAAPLFAVAEQSVIRGEVTGGTRTGQGTLMAGLHLQLDPGWKTYWRAPGDTGIPPVFDWSGSQNVKSVRIHWPRPRVFDTSGEKTVGYIDDVTLPLEVTPRDPRLPVRLRASVDLGVCSDICVPARIGAEADLDSETRTPHAIEAALAARPISARKAGLAAIACRIDPIADGLRLTAEMTLPDTGGTETVVIEPGLAGVWVSRAEVTRRGDRLTAVADLVPPSGAPFALARGGVVLTVLGSKSAVEITGCPAG